MKKFTAFNLLVTAILVISVGCAIGPKRPRITADDNPTTNAGRGQPSLDERTCPAAWIYINGQEGQFTDKGGQPLLQWIIDTPVCAEPTFSVEVFEDVLPLPVDFKCVLQSRDAEGTPTISYGIAADDGTFEVGKVYSLLSPCEHFTVRDPDTGEVLESSEPLAPGKYLIAGKLENREKGLETAAVTYFTVGAEEK